MHTAAHENTGEHKRMEADSIMKMAGSRQRKAGNGGTRYMDGRWRGVDGSGREDIKRRSTGTEIRQK